VARAVPARKAPVRCERVSELDKGAPRVLRGVGAATP